MPSDQPTRGPSRGRPALALIAVAMLSGCAGYTDAEACADMATMLWPWQQLDVTATEVAPAGTVPQTPVYPTRVILVSGLQESPVTGEPEPVVFECVHRGDLLQSFGWVAPTATAPMPPATAP